MLPIEMANQLARRILTVIKSVLVAILTIDDFDAYDVDPISCEFAGAYLCAGKWNTWITMATTI
jgi:hypothetical protein